MGPAFLFRERTADYQLAAPAKPKARYLRMTGFGLPQLNLCTAPKRRPIGRQATSSVQSPVFAKSQCGRRRRGRSRAGWLRDPGAGPSCEDAHRCGCECDVACRLGYRDQDDEASEGLAQHSSGDGQRISADGRPRKKQAPAAPFPIPSRCPVKRLLADRKPFPVAVTFDAAPERPVDDRAEDVAEAGDGDE